MKTGVWLLPVSYTHLDVYKRQDGTRHYFRRSEEDSNTYVDEDGLGFTVTANLATITIKDKDGNISCFNQTFRGGQLSYIQDSDGMEYSFSSFSTDSFGRGRAEIFFLICSSSSLSLSSSPRLA